MLGQPQWRVYQDPNFDLRADYKLRTCPYCGGTSHRHSLPIIRFPPDMCGKCASEHIDLSSIKW